MAERSMPRLDDRDILSIVKGLFVSYLAFEEIYRKYRTETLRFSEVEHWVDDKGQSPLYHLKEKCHALFRSSQKGSFHRKEWLLDLVLGSIFHEAMKLRENLYQLESYRPRYLQYQRRKGKSNYERGFEEHFEKIISRAQQGISEGIEELKTLFRDARALLTDFFRENRQNPLLVRFLVENQHLLRKIYGPGKQGKIFDVMFSRGISEAYQRAAQSYLASEHYDLSAIYYARALKINPLDDKLRFFLKFSLGMNAYLMSSYGKALSSFSKILSSPEKPRWQREYLKKAEEACRKISLEMKEEGRSRLVKRAKLLADQLKTCYL